MRRQLRWGEHRGYAKLAIEAGVPVVPTACPAADDMYYVLNDGWRVGEVLRRALGTRRNLPIPAAIGVGPLPRRVRLTQYVGEPIWSDTSPDEAASPEAVARLDAKVRASMRELLTRP